LADKLRTLPGKIFPTFLAAEAIALATPAASAFASDDAMLAVELGDCPGGKMISNSMRNVDCSRRDRWYRLPRRRSTPAVKDTM
jgi:hypothetical protein